MLAFKHRRIDHMTCFSDTAKPRTHSYSGNKYFQLTTTHFGLLHVYTMKSKSDAHHALKEFVERFGIPGTMLTDNAFEERTGEWGRLCNALVIEQRTTEPHTPKQNRAEREIQEVTKNGDRLMSRFQIPRCFWDHVYKYYADLRNHLAIPRDILRGRTPLEMALSDTPDISEFITFHLYQPVWFHQPPAKYPESKSIVGRWLGPAHGVGQLLCYKILQSNAKIVIRSTVQAMDLTEDAQRAALVAFDLELHKRIRLHLNDYESPYPFTDNESDDDSIEGLGGALEETDLDLTEPNVDPIIGSQVCMSRGDGKPVIGDVVQRKCNESGEIIGNAHVDPKQDTRIYRVRYPDGTMEELLYNSIIENLYSRCDTAGELHPVVKRIVGIVKPRRNPHILHKWILQIQWMDDTITEENVEVMRGSHLYEVAQYIHENGLANEPAFTRWVPQTLRQHARAIALVKRRSSHTPKIQYGIEIPDPSNTHMSWIS
jgi:hypothetical protein